MITSTHIDIGAIRESEKRIYEHIGRLTVSAAQVDQFLSALLAWTTSSPDQEKAKQIFEGEQVGVKLRLLSRALPDAWPEKKRLSLAVSKIQDYRNKLAHSVVAWSFSIPSGRVNYNLHREHKGGMQEEVDFDELLLWESRAEALGAGLMILTKFFLRSGDIIEADLRELIQEFYTSPSEAQQAAIDYLFPPLTGRGAVKA